MPSLGRDSRIVLLHGKLYGFADDLRASARINSDRLDFENLHWLLLGRDANYLAPLLRRLLRAVQHLGQLGHTCRLPVTGQELGLLLTLFHRFL